MSHPTARLYVATGDSIARLDEKEGVWRVADGRLFAGLANGELWESPDHGDRWRSCGLDEPLSGPLALVYVTKG